MRFSEEEHRQWFNTQPRKPMSAAVIFRDEQDNTLLVKPNYRDEWNLPGGVIEEHESPLDGAMREVREELGLKLEKASLRFCSVDYRPASAGLTDKLYFYFDGGVLNSTHISRIVLQTNELDNYRFVSLRTCEELTSPWTYRQIAQALSEDTRSLYLESGYPTNKAVSV